MLRFCARELTGADAETAFTQEHRFALLESFGLHARSLSCFFFGDSEAGDLKPEHFVADVDAWRRERGKKPRELKDVRVRVGTEMAHVTRDRIGVGPEERSWNVQGITDALGTLWDTFLRHRKPEIAYPPPTTAVIAEGTGGSATGMSQTLVEFVRGKIGEF
jgi:hypothetical protein